MIVLNRKGIARSACILSGIVMPFIVGGCGADHDGAKGTSESITRNVDEGLVNGLWDAIGRVELLATAAQEYASAMPDDALGYYVGALAAVTRVRDNRDGLPNQRGLPDEVKVLLLLGNAATHFNVPKKTSEGMFIGSTWRSMWRFVAETLPRSEEPLSEFFMILLFYERWLDAFEGDPIMQLTALAGIDLVLRSVENGDVLTAELTGHIADIRDALDQAFRDAKNSGGAVDVRGMTKSIKKFRIGAAAASLSSHGF